jgi:putative tryptophan/tyrosine transport system substrate-binding protein
MRRIGLAVVLALSFTLVSLAGEAQQAGKAYRIGVLAGGSQQVSPAPKLLPKALRDLGYIEGQNLAIEWRFAHGDPARLPELAADLVSLKVDVLLTVFMPEVLAARRATASIPIVMIASADPVGNGLVASLARPGGNITGMTIQPPEFGGKQVELIKQAVPRVSRLAVVWEPLFPGFMAYYQHAQTAARALGITPIAIEIANDGLAVWPSQAFAVHVPRVLEFAVQNRLPSIYPTRTFMGSGGLMSHGTDLNEIYSRDAAYVDRIMKGAKPAELPVEQPTRYELVVNLREAKTLGLTIPPALLLRADQVIE